MTRRCSLAVLCAFAATLAALAGGATRPASAAGSTLVTMASADASPVDVTMATAYSFFVNPDVQMPRATAGIAAGRSTAVASPADPGDDLDALGGVAVPMAEQTAIDQLRQNAKGAPDPFKTVLNTAADGLSTIATTTSPVTGLLDTPVEHVVAAYPNAQHPGTQTATFGPDPSFADPTGLLAVEGAAGRASAGDGTAVSEAGAGLATASMLGVQIGRVSAHAETHSGAGKVTSDAVSEVDNVDLLPAAIPGLTLPQLPLPAGTALLHLGAVRTTLHSERVAGAAAAVSTSHVEVTGVSVLGASATLDGSGLHLLGASVALKPAVDALNAALTGVVGAVNSAIPPSTPFGGHPVVPLGHLLGPAVATAAPHGADETRQQGAGLAITIAGTVLAPAQIPPSLPGPPQLVAQPALLTLTLAAARTDAYGRTLQPLPVPPPAPASGTIGAGSTAPPLSAPAVSAPNPTAPAPAAATGEEPGLPTEALQQIETALSGAPMPPGAVITLAGLAEALLLGALVRRYRTGRGQLPEPLPGPEELV